MPRNFYLVLGISPDADLDAIRRAYRRLVRQYHPDTGYRPVERFLEVREAYETLRDGQLRRDHDRDLAAESMPGSPSASWERLEGFFTPVDEFFAGWVPGVFTRPGKRGPPPRKNLYAELVLEPEEAAQGGLFPLQVPVERICEACGGLGLERGLSCGVCGGRGRSVSYHVIEIAVPRGVADGTRVRLPLDGMGLSGVELVIWVSVI